MLIFTEDNSTVVLNDATMALFTAKFPYNYFWCLDTDELDFTLAPLTVIEDMVGPTLTIQVGPIQLEIPANWYILVADNETKQIDVVNLANTAGTTFQALYYGPDTNRYGQISYKVIDYNPRRHIVAPLLNKHQMLCHPISETHWICVSPHDTYKRVKNAVISDLIF